MTLAQLFPIAKPASFLFISGFAACVAAALNVYVRDVATARPATSASVDLRGNTDESWRRGIDYLYRKILSSRLEQLKK
jgi:hypothetical protein